MPDDGMKIDLPASLADRVKAAAAESGESVEALVGRALEAWLGDETEDTRSLAELERRWAAVQAGEKTVPNDAVVRWLETWGSPSFRPWRDQ
jgi:predicted transcriptional regulator